MMIDMGSFAACHEQEEQSVFTQMPEAHTVFFEKKSLTSDFLSENGGFTFPAIAIFSHNTLLILRIYLQAEISRDAGEIMDKLNINATWYHSSFLTIFIYYYVA